MVTSMMVGRFLALMFLAVGVSLLAGQLRGRDLFDSLRRSPALTIMLGAAAMFCGYVLVTIHNTWIWASPVIITLFGWVAIVEGFLLLAFPRALFALVDRFATLLDREKLWGVLALVLAGVFGWDGFAVGG